MARGKRAESTPKPKDETPETTETEAPEGIGHNSEAEATPTPDPLTEDQRIALTFMHKKLYSEALALKKAADAQLKNSAKLARAELGPTAINDIKDMIALESPEGEAALRQNVERQMKIARWMGMAVGTQAEIFVDVDRTPAIERAKAEGKRVGLAGDPCAPPHAPETEQYREWMAGFHEGQAVLAKGIRPMPVELADSDDLDALTNAAEVADDAAEADIAAAKHEHATAH